MSDPQPGSDRPSGDADARPQPRYGVYATPEEQAARIQKPDATRALETGESVAGAPASTEARVAPPAGAGVRRHPVDRIVTIALLAYGLVNVAVAAVSLFDFTEYATMVFTVLGIPGEFTNIEGGRTWGAAAAVALVVGFTITAWFTVRRMVAGKIAWWVPLAGAAITHIIVGVLAVIPLLADPAFALYAG